MHLYSNLVVRLLLGDLPSSGPTFLTMKWWTRGHEGI